MRTSNKKLRFLITLHALFKYTDENHRLNSKKLNSFLRPYGVESGYRSLSDTIDVLRQFGVDVQTHGVHNKHGVWLGKRLLSEETLKFLLFAINTNPHLSSQQTTDLLEKLKPLVTVYQEPLLQNVSGFTANVETPSSLMQCYATLHEAICNNRRVYLFTENQEPSKRKALFTPRYLCKRASGICVVGYLHRSKKVKGIDLQEITKVEMVLKHKTVKQDVANEMLSCISLDDYIKTGT